MPDKEPEYGDKGDEGEEAENGKEGDSPMWEDLVRGGPLKVAVTSGEGAGCRGHCSGG